MCVQFQLNLVQAILARMEGHVRTVEMDSTANALNSLLTGPVAQVSHDIDIPEIISLQKQDCCFDNGLVTRDVLFEGTTE